MENIKKVIVCGDGGVGRTTLLYRITENYFSSETKMTLGVQFFSKSFEIEGVSHRIIFFDLAGQERWRCFQDKLVKGAEAAILAFDLTRPTTLENIEEWVNLLRIFNKELPIMLIGMKTDLIQDIMVEDEYVECFKGKYNIFDYIKVSTKIGENVDIVFENLLRKIMGMDIIPTTSLIFNQRSLLYREDNQKLSSFFKVKNNFENIIYYDFLRFFSTCPICKSKNHKNYLRDFYFNNDPDKIKLKQRLISLRYESKDFYDLYLNKISIGIPCCNCFRLFFEEN